MEAQVKATKARLGWEQGKGEKSDGDRKTPMKSTDYTPVTCSIQEFAF